jgi:hypothetical protein
METIFTLGDEPGENVRVNLDDLYERKKQHDLNTLAIYNRILNRIHGRIKTISRQQVNDQFCWYIIPEMIIGVPKYDHEACTAFILDKLNDNGFIVKYTHPNMLFISWKHWVPAYVRSEYKKKTGVVIYGYGNLVDRDSENNRNLDDPNDLILHKNNNNISIHPKNGNKEYKDISTYIPSGKLIYNENLLKKIEDKSR